MHIDIRNVFVKILLLIFMILNHCLYSQHLAFKQTPPNIPSPGMKRRRHGEEEIYYMPVRYIYLFINWVVRALNADCLTAVVYQTVYCCNYVENQFIIAIRHLRGLWYMANIPQLRDVSRHSTLRRA